MFSLFWLEVPVHQIEQESHQAEEVDEDEPDADPLRDSDKIVHAASLKC